MFLAYSPQIHYAMNIITSYSDNTDLAPQIIPAT